MRPYKTYAALIFVIYLAVVVVFHFELQKNLGLKYAAFREESDRKLDRALERIEVLNRRIQDLSKMPVYTSPEPKMISPKTRQAVKPITVRIENRRLPGAGEDLGALYWNSNFDFTRPRMHYCSGNVTHSFHTIGRMHIYSAYYDDRNSSAHFIRMMALLPLRYRLTFQCEFQHQNGRLTSDLEYYEMCENHARAFGGFILSCAVPPIIKEPPCTFKITSYSNLTPASQKKLLGNVTELSVPVLASNQLSRTPKKRFALCIPPIFGSIKQRLLVEFIEMNLLLGVQHLNFYTFQINSDMDKILDHYQRLGVVSKIKWYLPVTSNKVWYNGQLLTINDCLYRNMYHFDYIGFHDIDELMVPHGKHTTWSDLIDTLNQDFNDTQAGYVFPSAFFDISNRTRPGLVPNPYFSSETKRKAVFSQVRTKCLVKPTRIFELGIHHISRTFQSGDGVHRLKEDQGYLHHFRKCVTEFDPRMKCAAQTTDSQLTVFDKELKRRSQLSMEKIFKHMAKLVS